MEEFLTSIGKAADELGYGIRAIDLREIELTPHRGPKNIESVTIRYAYVISGDDIRRILRPVEKGEPK